MKKQSPFMAITLGFMVLTSPAHVQARTPQESVAELVSTVEVIDSRFRSSGIEGLQSLSEQCYAALGPAYRCLYIDVAAASLDRGAVATMQQYQQSWSRRAYFDGVAWAGRVAMVLRHSDIPTESIPKYLSNLERLLDQALSQKADQ